MNRKSLVIIYAIVVLFSLILLCGSTFAATIHGSIYDEDFKKINKALVSIDSEPAQKMLADDGSYSFSVPNGDYKVKAEYKSEFSTYVAEEDITIKEEGDFVIDLFLFTTFAEEEEILQEAEEFSEQFVEEEFNFVALAIVVLWLVVIWIIIKFFTEQKKGEEHSDLKKYIDYIKKEKRTTQKEIRKEFPLSEAKISLIIAELEKKGIIEKIKKGRGNIIIYKKS